MQSLAIGVAILLKAVKKIGLREKQVWEYSYKINRQPYNGTGFGDKDAPELLPYRSKMDNDIQELFDYIGQDK